MHAQRFVWLIAASLLLSLPAHAQQVQSLAPAGDAPELIGAQPQARSTLDLGQTDSTRVRPAPAQSAAASTVAGMSLPAPLSPSGGARAAAARAQLRPVPAALTTGPVERAVFAREPVRVNLDVGQERLITLPAEALLHVPSDMDAVARIESIGGTIYVTALVAFAPIRIIAELVDSGQQIPFDLVAQAETKNTTRTGAGELQVAVMEPSTVANPTVTAPAEPPAVDMVELTRHAARQLYAPRRLAVATAGVSQIDVQSTPVAGLIRGVNVEAMPVGQWRSANLFVTAVRITNLSRYALEVPLEQVRGRWIAATAQHGRIGPAGTDTDTTAIYLVCERSFESCL